MNEEDDRNALPPGAADAWTGAEPSAGFAERAVAAWQAEASAAPTHPAPHPSTRGVSRWWWTAVAAAAAVVALFWFSNPSGRAAEGLLVPATRTEARIAQRATVVAEAGANLRWQVAANGNAHVIQDAGSVFYRVERGGEFVVVTPHGEVRVLGTCFRVEVPDMTGSKKQMIAAGAVGAALSAAILVTVYEGKVLLANPHGETRLAAGEQAQMGDGTAPTLASAAGGAEAAAGGGPMVKVRVDEAPVVAPAPDASREELLVRDEQQRAEIMRLRQENATLATKAARGGRGELQGEDFFNPTKEQLLEMAAQCEIRFDTPDIDLEPEQIGPKRAAEMGLSEAEVTAVNGVMKRIHGQVLAELRAMYVEVTGDEAAAEGLAPQALMAEIQNKSSEADVKEAHYRISQERAGLMQPPADLESRPAAERYLRLMQRLGNDLESEVAGVLGTDRARAMRAKNGGWGSRSRSMMGDECKPTAK